MPQGGGDASGRRAGVTRARVMAVFAAVATGLGAGLLVLALGGLLEAAWMLLPAGVGLGAALLVWRRPATLRAERGGDCAECDRCQSSCSDRLDAALEERIGAWDAARMGGYAAAFRYVPVLPLLLAASGIALVGSGQRAGALVCGLGAAAAIALFGLRAGFVGRAATRR